MPAGWQLWLPAASPAAGDRARATGSKRVGVPWYRRTWGTLLLLVLFFPAGLYLVWRRQPWRSGVKWALTGATALFLTIAVAAGGSAPPPRPAGDLSAPLASQPVSAPVTTSPAMPTATSPSGGATATSAGAAAASASPTPARSTAAPPTKAPVIVPAPTKPATSQPVRVLPPPVQHTSAPASSCYPLTDKGKCYEPGEFCRKSDHGATGVAGDGERIICADKNGWRWEPL